MRRSLFHKLFPPPRYLEVRPTGLDISDQSVKFSELSPWRTSYALTKYGEREIPIGAIEAGKVKDAGALEAALRTLGEEQKINYVVASLPEEEAYIVRITMPEMAESELRGSVELQLEEHVPIPATEAIFDYEILERPKDSSGNYELVVSVLPRQTVASYSDAIFNAGLNLLAFEIEAQAIARAVVPAGEVTAALVVDFGKTRTSFLVVVAGRVLLSSTVNNVGGEDITKAIEKNLHLDYAAAEKIKIEKGLLYARREQDLLFSIIPIASILKDEVGKQLSYWRDQALTHHYPKIDQVILCGGQATLPGLTEYLALGLGLPVTLGNVWSNTVSPSELLPPLNLNQSLRYATAIGLSLRYSLPS